MIESILSILETRIPRILKKKKTLEKNRKLILSIFKEFIDIKKLNKRLTKEKKQKRCLTDFEQLMSNKL